MTTVVAVVLRWQTRAASTCARYVFFVVLSCSHSYCTSTLTSGGVYCLHTNKTTTDMRQRHAEPAKLCGGYRQARMWTRSDLPGQFLVHFAANPDLDKFTLRPHTEMGAQTNETSKLHSTHHTLCSQLVQALDGGLWVEVSTTTAGLPFQTVFSHWFVES